MTVGTQILVGAGHWPGASCPVHRRCLGDRKWSRRIHPRRLCGFQTQKFSLEFKKNKTICYCYPLWTLGLEHSNFYVDYGVRMQNECNTTLLQRRRGSFAHTYFLWIIQEQKTEAIRLREKWLKASNLEQHTQLLSSEDTRRTIQEGDLWQNSDQSRNELTRCSSSSH